MIAAIEDPDPVIFFEPKRIYNGPFDGHHDKPVKPWSKHPASEVPEGHYIVPLGKAAVVREGADLTILAYGTMVHVALASVEEQGLDAEVIDLRTLVPLDIEAIEQSVAKTGRCLIVQEAPRTSGFAAELVRARPGALLLSSRSAGRARDRLGHALPALVRMGLFPRPEAHQARA